jgi:hypothetical protein
MGIDENDSGDLKFAGIERNELIKIKKKYRKTRKPVIIDETFG